MRYRIIDSIRQVILITLLLSGASSILACKAKKEETKEVVFRREQKEEKPVKTNEIQQDTKKDISENSATHREERGEATPTQLMLLDKAKAAQRIDNISEAEKYYTELLKTSPLSPQKESGMIALSQIYRDTGNLTKATSLLEELRQKDPELPEVYFLLGRAYAANQEVDKAIPMYEKLLEMQPDYLLAMIELSALYNMKGEKEKVAKLLTKYESKVYQYAKVAEAGEKAPLEEKKYALEVLSMVSDDRATKAVYKALEDTDPHVRYEALLIIADDEPEEKILRRVESISKNDPELRIRMLAKETLQALQQKKALLAEQQK